MIWSFMDRVLLALWTRWGPWYCGEDWRRNSAGVGGRPRSRIKKLIPESSKGYFFLPSLREISSTILGRRSASTLSTMLAISPLSWFMEASSGAFSAPAATAMAASERSLSSADVEGEDLWSPDSRMRRQLAQAAAVDSLISDSFFDTSVVPPAEDSPDGTGSVWCDGTGVSIEDSGAAACG